MPDEHVVTIPRALRPAGLGEDPLPWMVATVNAVLERAAAGALDVIHSHLELLSIPLAAASPVPVIATFHGRVDHPALARALHGAAAQLVAISAAPDRGEGRDAARSSCRPRRRPASR